jgi:DNA primase
MWLDSFVQATAQAVDDRVREALYARGVTDDQIALYQIGYIDRKLPELEYPPKFIDWCFAGEKLDEMFVLPLTNAVGEIKGLQFRHTEQERKGYTDFVPEKGEAVLFGLGQAIPHVWNSRRVLLVEGAFDLFPMQRYFPDVTATLTAHLLDALVRVLRRIEVSDIWLGYDRDQTGRDSAQKIVKHYGKYFRVHTLNFPDVKMVDNKTAKDPSGLWETWGEEKFGEKIRGLIERADSLPSALPGALDIR